MSNTSQSYRDFEIGDLVTLEDNVLMILHCHDASPVALVAPPDGYPFMALLSRPTDYLFSQIKCLAKGQLQ
jgi:hypothetical protein